MNKNEKIELFDLLQKLNNAIIGTVGHYDLSNATLQTFIRQNNIMTVSYTHLTLPTN